MGPTVVVSPLIALMKDQVDSLRELGVPASQLDSSLSSEAQRQVAADLRAGRLHLLFVSPERLVTNEWLQNMLRDVGTKTFAIDEAHCISHWGHDFRPEYRQLAKLKEMFPESTVHAFTATATTPVRQDIADQLKLSDPEILVGNFDRPNLTYRILPRRDLFGQIREVLDRHASEAGIIYCPRRKDVDEISQALAADKSLGRKVAGYHAGMSPELRRRAQNLFIEEECDLIVATIAFGMGIDRSNIRFVLHTAMPKSIESYQQETGRAGRDGLEAECVLLYSGADPIQNKMLIEKSASDASSGGIKLDPDFVPTALRHINDMDRFARGASCRHSALVEYFGQTYQGPAEAGDDARGIKGCGACDMCLGDTSAVGDSNVIAQKILSCIARTGERFGAVHIISVLRGEQNQRVKSLHHDELSTYALLAGYSQAELRDYIYQLLGQGALAQESLTLANGRTAPILKLNRESVEVMKGKRNVRLVQIVRKSATESRQTRGEAVSWEGVDQPLFDALRAWRKQIAAQRNVPPYVIFSDATLRELARTRPTTLHHFRLTRGVGENKLKDFGQDVIALIGDHCKDRVLSTDVMARPAPQPAPARPNLSRPNPNKDLAWRMFATGLSVKEVAGKTGRARATINEYLAEYIEQKKPATIDHWVPREVYKKVAAAEKELGPGALKPLFLALGEQIPYDQIRAVVAHLRSGANKDDV
jgi:ATP-dependent DNA helicase RecQ